MVDPPECIWFIDSGDNMPCRNDPHGCTGVDAQNNDNGLANCEKLWEKWVDTRPSIGVPAENYFMDEIPCKKSPTAPDGTACSTCFGTYSMLVRAVQLGPKTETCGNSVDDDCDGQTDEEGCTPPPTPTPSPTPTPTPPPDWCIPRTNPSMLDPAPWNYCDGPCEEYAICPDWNDEGCFCNSYCPVVIDVNGNGFDLTNAQYGVDFDITNSGTPIRISWTSAGSDDSWLVMDRNGNGTIDSGTELFGTYTAQTAPPQGEEKNGFLALAEYDRLINGGNRDGEISAQDAVFGSLRLWQDSNHNGTSEPSELKTLSQVGLREIDLKYKESRRTDEYGNKFKYRAKVKDIHGAQLGRWAWDVFLRAQP